MDKKLITERIKQATSEAIEKEQLPEKFSGRLTIIVEINVGYVRDLSMEKKNWPLKDKIKFDF